MGQQSTEFQICGYKQFMFVCAGSKVDSMLVCIVESIPHWSS